MLWSITESSSVLRIEPQGKGTSCPQTFGEGAGGGGDLQELSGTQEQDLTKSCQGGVDHSDMIGSQAQDGSVEGGCTGEFPEVGLWVFLELKQTCRTPQGMISYINSVARRLLSRYLFHPWQTPEGDSPQGPVHTCSLVKVGRGFVEVILTPVWATAAASLPQLLLTADAEDPHSTQEAPSMPVTPASGEASWSSLHWQPFGMSIKLD